MLGDSSRLNGLVNAGKMQKEDENKILFFTASFGKVDTMKLLQSKGLNLRAIDEKGIHFLWWHRRTVTWKW